MSRLARVAAVVLSGKKTYAKTVLALDPIAYWKLDETSGTSAADATGNGCAGTYSGVTLANTAGPITGTLAPLFSAANNSYVNIYSATFAGRFNKNEGTLAIWAKVLQASVWTDTTYRCMIQIKADANNATVCDKTNTNNTVRGTYFAAATNRSQTTTTTSTGWIHCAVVFSKAGNYFRYYLNGAQQGTDQTVGNWVAALSTNDCAIGAYTTTPTGVWGGYLAHAAVFDRPLTPAQVLTLATVI